MFDEFPDVVVTLGAAAVAAVGALVVIEVAYQILKRIGRRSELIAQFARRLHSPAQLLAIVLAVQAVVHATTGGGGWRAPTLHAITLLVIACSAWVVGAVLLTLEDAALARFRTDVQDNQIARRVHTQIMVVRRVTVAVVVVVCLGAMLVTFPTARAAGASLLASAGIAGVVAALAAQSMLGNVFAGVQLAFSDELRLDDVVVVEGEWGRVEDITLSYVVLHLWDDRRLTLPTSYFTTKPFQNWTRNSSALLGAVELDVDWMVPTHEMRAELRTILEDTDLWDERACVLQVTDAVGGVIRVRALVTAKDAGTLFDLRCYVRERLVEWLRENYPESLPRQRTDVSGVPMIPDGHVSSEARPRVAEGTTERDSRVFGGSADGRERNAAFTGPQEDQ